MKYYVGEHLMSNNLDFINKVYEISNSYKIYYARIQNSKLEDLMRLARIKFNGEEYNDKLLGKFLIPLRFILYKVSTYLIPYNNLVEEKKMVELSNTLNSILSIYPEKQEYKVLFDLLSDCLNNNRNDISEYLSKNVIKYNSQAHAIVTKRELDDSQKKYIIMSTGVDNISFYSDNSFKNMRDTFDLVVFIGNENYFDYSFNNVPRAPVNYYVTLNMYSNTFTDNNMFSHFNGKSYYSTLYQGLHKKFIVEGDEKSALKDKTNISTNETVMYPNIEEPTISIGLLKEIIIKFNSESEEKRFINVVPIELTQNRFILLASHNKRYEVLTLEKNLEKKLLDDITTDDFLLVRNESEGTLIREVANEMFMDQNILIYRKRQQRLKEHLQKLVDKYSVEKLCLLLEKKGLITINELKIKNLLKEESFKLQNNQEFLKLLYILTGNNKEKAYKFFKSSRMLSNFHIQAGRKISKEIRGAINEADLTVLYENGTQKIELSQYKGASFNLEKIKSISSEHFKVPVSQEKKIIYAEDIGYY